VCFGRDIALYENPHLFIFADRKLHEVRQRLNQLRDLVQYYQKMKTQPGAAGDGEDQMADGQVETVDSETA
jgi:hypothetical protein